jgi:alpha-ribazole phosphatase/probable phosphoglycerate mutase
MTELLVVRHAQTDLAGTFCGHSDPPLNEVGRKQVQTLSHSLLLGSYDVVFTSDLQRARQTAASIADHLCVSSVELPALREIYFGAWEGLTWKQIEASCAPYASRWMAEFPDMPAPGGESFADFQSRVLEALDLMIEMSSHERAIVVTHAGVMRTILTARCGVSNADAWTRTKDYCCTFRYPLAGEVHR